MGNRADISCRYLIAGAGDEEGGVGKICSCHRGGLECSKSIGLWEVGA